MSKCPNCGTEAPDGAKFCAECGQSLDQPEAESAPEPAALPTPEQPQEKKKTKLPRWLLFVVGGVLFALVACCAIVLLTPRSESSKATSTARAVARATQSAVPSTPTAAPVSTATFTPKPKPTNTPEPTSTPKPTSTPTVTNTPKPTNTPRPTNTPKPTNTPIPTYTPTPPPEPVVLTGTGDAVVNVDKQSDLCLVHIVGNAASKHFAVTSFNDAGDQLDLLVNTTEPYDGVRPLDLREGQETTRFQVKAQGAWTIELLPASPALWEAHGLDVPGKFEGTGDYVIILSGKDPDTATIVGNAAGKHFAVISYGSRIKLLVNTTDPYEGTVVMPSDAVLIEIKAVGPWSIDITGR